VCGGGKGSCLAAKGCTKKESSGVHPGGGEKTEKKGEKGFVVKGGEGDEEAV